VLETFVVHKKDIKSSISGMFAHVLQEQKAMHDDMHQKNFLNARWFCSKESTRVFKAVATSIGPRQIPFFKTIILWACCITQSDEIPFPPRIRRRLS